MRGAVDARGIATTVMLRPEQIFLDDGKGDREVRGTVRATLFFGHDAVAKVTVETPRRIEVLARAIGHRLPRPGQEVTISVEGSALAFGGSDGGGDSRQRVTELGDPVRQVHMQPV